MTRRYNEFAALYDVDTSVGPKDFHVSVGGYASDPSPGKFEVPSTQMIRL